MRRAWRITTAACGLLLLSVGACESTKPRERSPASGGTAKPSSSAASPDTTKPHGAATSADTTKPRGAAPSPNIAAQPAGPTTHAAEPTAPIPSSFDYTRADRSALWQRSGHDVLHGFRNLYAAKVVRVPDAEWPLRMWFFGWATTDCNEGEPGCDAIYHARGRDLDHWEVYAGPKTWDASMDPSLWKPVFTPRDRPYDQWHNGDPSVVYRNGVYYMAYSATGFNRDGKPANDPADTDGELLCIMAATSPDGIRWRRAEEPIVIQRAELGAPRGTNGEFVNGMYHRPSLLWDHDRWRLWFDYWTGDSVSMGYAEGRGGFFDPTAWTVIRAGDQPLIRHWPNPEVIKVGGKYWSYSDPPIPPGTDAWKSRQIAEAVSDDGLRWTVLGHIDPDADTPACQVPTPYVDETTIPPTIVLFYSCQIGGEPYDWRFDRIRYMTRPAR